MEEQGQAFTVESRLRELAERQTEFPSYEEIRAMSVDDVAAMVHELETHQIELEVQNERLRISQIELLKARKRYSDLYDFAPVGYLTIDPEGIIKEANIGFAEMLGVERERIIGESLNVFVHKDSQDECYLFISESLKSKPPRICELRMTHVDSSSVDSKDVFWVRVDSKLRFNGDKDTYLDLSFSNITEQRRDQALLKQQAFYDTLTELPNRKLFINRFEQYLAHLQRRENYGALFYIDIDNFKLINDSLGHQAGDKVLQHVASVLASNTRAEDTAARFGGDEFVVLLTDLDLDKDIAALESQKIANKICQALVAPWSLDGLDLRIEVSMGIVVFPMGSQFVEEIISHADLTMYRAKKSGKNSVEFYHRGMQGHVKQLLEFQQDLRQALEGQEFILNYQPRFDQFRNIVGAECLLRWRHPQKGEILPDKFIPVLEESSRMIIEVGNWVLTHACKQLLRWQQLGGDFSRLTLAVNVSPRQFNHHDFVDQVKRVLKKTGVNPELLVLEVTENILLNNVNAVIKKMDLLKKFGVTFAIDDFGTGYSSLSYLKRLPLDILKIDQSFVKKVDADKDNAMLVETIIVMAKHLELKIIAEGVETESEKALLIEKGCSFFQGSVFSSPLPIDDFDTFMQAAATHS